MKFTIIPLPRALSPPSFVPLFTVQGPLRILEASTSFLAHTSWLFLADFWVFPVSNFFSFFYPNVYCATTPSLLPPISPFTFGNSRDFLSFFSTGVVLRDSSGMLLNNPRSLVPFQRSSPPVVSPGVWPPPSILHVGRLVFFPLADRLTRSYPFFLSFSSLWSQISPSF